MVSRRKALITIGSTLSTVAIAGCGGESGEVDTEEESEESGDGGDGEESRDGGDGEESGGDGESGDDEEVVFHNVELTSDSLDDAVVQGEATNELGSEETITIQATFYNEEGTIIDDGISDIAEDIPDGQRFQFEIISTVEYSNVADYDVEWETFL